MKTLLINGSPNAKRCTFTALSKVSEGLAKFTVDTEIVSLGEDPVKPCIGCGACSKTQRCAFGDDDGVNELIEKIIDADALVLGSPVFYAGINGSLKSVLDRVFFAAGSQYAYKPGGAVVNARRAGTTAALDQLNKYFLISQMPLVSSFYWPMTHGQSVEQMLQDEEGCQTAWQLGANIGWLLQCIEAGSKVGALPVQLEDRSWTNFIR